MNVQNLDQFSDARILVTGAAGFIGGNLVRYVLERMTRAEGISSVIVAGLPAF